MRTRILMKNICYAGVLAALCELDLDIIRALLAETYAKKPQLVDANMKAIQLGYDYARAHFELPAAAAGGEDGRHRAATSSSTAIPRPALGCVYAGATVGAWYPITPSTSLMDAFKGFCDKLRVDPATGRKNYIMIQAEDELASIGMVIGASWNGARAFTATSGPGISLMQEFLGLAYYAEVPAVVFDIQRVGPVDRHADPHPAGRSALGRLRLARRHAPGVPVSGQSRGMLRVRGQGVRSGRAAADAGAGAVGPGHRHERLDVPGVQVGRELSCPIAARCSMPSSSQKIDSFWRYYDHDNDGIPQRTLPGVHPKGAYFARGSGHNAVRRATPRTPRNTRWWSTGCARNG